MARLKSIDPMEQMIEDALLWVGEPYEHEVPVGNRRVDFYLPRKGLYIEVKQFHTNRISDQMVRCDNIIVAQGRQAVQTLASMIMTWRNA